jgi:anti-anti-sigma factor
MDTQRYRSPILEITASCPPSGATLGCRGEIDLSSAGCLEGALRAWTAAAVPTLTVDLRETAYLDSSIVEALLRAQYVMQREGRHLRILVRPRRARLFQVLRLDRVLDISSGPPADRTPLDSLRSREARRTRKVRKSGPTSMTVIASPDRPAALPAGAIHRQ